MRLCGPICCLLGETVRLLEGHFRHKRMHGARRSVLCYMRICELDISVPGPLFGCSLAPREDCGAIEVHVLRRWRFGGGGC